MNKVKQLCDKYTDMGILFFKTFIITGIGQFIGMIIINFLFTTLLNIIVPSFAKSATWKTASLYFANIGIWFTIIYYLKKNKKEERIIDTFTTKLRENNLFAFVIGVLLGFGMNYLCALLALRNNDIQLSFNSFNIFNAILIFIAILVQAGSEEIMCRGYLYQRILQKYKKPWIAIVFNSLLFALLHIMNDGVTIISLLSIFFAGLLPSLIMYYFDSMWMCIGEHLMWNYTQNVILGLPNSGILTPYSFYKLNVDTAKNSFYYNVGFGIEGSVFSVIVMAVVCLLIYLVMRNHHKPNYDVWQNQQEQLYQNEPIFSFGSDERKEDEKFTKKLQKEYDNKVAKGMKDNGIVDHIEILEKMKKSYVSSNKYFDTITYIIPLPFAFIMGYSESNGGFKILTVIAMFIFETVLFLLMKKPIHKLNQLRIDWIENKQNDIKKETNNYIDN